MDNSAASSLTSAIQASSRRRSLEELAAEGKKHVRVVSAKKVMDLITAIVDDAIERETSRKTKKDRARIIGETKDQFDRVMKLQAQQESEVRKHREATEEAREQLNTARDRVRALVTELEEERVGQAAREAKLLAEYQERLSNLVAEYDSEIERLREDRKDLTGKLRSESEQLDRANRKLENQKHEIAANEQAEKRHATDTAEAAGALAAAGRTIESLEERVERSSAHLQEERERSGKIGAELNAAKQEIRHLVSVREEQEEKNAHLLRERDLREAEIAHLEDGFGSHEEEIERNRKARQEHDAEIERGRKVHREQEEEIERLMLVRKDLEGKLIRLENERDEMEAVRKSLEGKGENAANAIAEFTARLEESNERFETASREHEAEVSVLSLEHRSEVDRLEQDRAEFEAQVQSLRSETEEYQEKISRLDSEREDLLQRFEAEKGDLAGRQEQALAEAHRQIENLATERDLARRQEEDIGASVKKSDRTLRRLQTRQAKTRESLKSREAEVERLSANLASVTEQLEEAQATIEDAQQSTESAAVTEIRESLLELRDAVSAGNGKQGLDQENLNSLLDSLGERDMVLENRLGDQMSQTMAEISRSVRAATASPIEVNLEATDVLVDRLFDQESEMETNLDSISMQELGGGEVITGNLELLKATRILSSKSES